MMKTKSLLLCCAVSCLSATGFAQTLADSFEKLPEPDLQSKMWKTSTGPVVKSSPQEMVSKIKSLKRGQTLLVAPGELNQVVNVTVSGTADAPITLKAEKKHQTQVKGFKLSGDYIIIDGFEITNPTPKSVGIDTGEVHRETARTGCQMHNNYIHDIVETAINTGVDGLATGNLIRNVGRGFMVNSGSLVEGNEVDTLLPQTMTKKGKETLKKTQYAFFAGDKIVFRGNYFHGTAKEHLKAGMGVCFFTTWDYWIIGSSSQILIENNIGFNATHASEPEQGKLMKSSNFTYRNNLFGDTVFVGVFPKKIPYLTIENNTFINCGAYPVWFATPLQATGSVVRNNLIAYVNRGPDVQAYGWKAAESGIRIDAKASEMEVGNNLYHGCLNRKYAASDFEAEPMFVNASKKDFRLKPGSPGVDKNVGISNEIVIAPLVSETSSTH